MGSVIISLSLEGLHLAAIPFRGSRPNTRRCRDLGLFRRGQIVIKPLCFDRRTTPHAQRHNPNNPDPARLWEGQNIARRHWMCGLADFIAVHPHMPTRHLL